ncbi:mediator of RNA polymerase II transcription subunit 15a [Cucumis melo var. makuwa]|nr:mediator of RNA polymerase II transcription subunit 15a [Cucumis melo var. makuwa]TYK06971.1 mediator of RNA polymerase II transcription subunit 15a [Cucumis melo var. makuwa]
MAVRFEEKIYTQASRQLDYLKKISLKMLIIESVTQHPMGNSLPSNRINNIEDPELEYLSEDELFTKMIEEEWNWGKVMGFIAKIK